MSIKEDSYKRRTLDLEIKAILLDIQWLKDEIELKREYLALLKDKRASR